jgi:hypothetical protein
MNVFSYNNLNEAPLRLRNVVEGKNDNSAWSIAMSPPRYHDPFLIVGTNAHCFWRWTNITPSTSSTTSSSASTSTGGIGVTDYTPKGTRDPGHDHNVPCVDISNDGRWCASACIDGKIRVTSLASKQDFNSSATSGSGMHEMKQIVCVAPHVPHTSTQLHRPQHEQQRSKEWGWSVRWIPTWAAACRAASASMSTVTSPSQPITLTTMTAGSPLSSPSPTVATVTTITEGGGGAGVTRVRTLLTHAASLVTRLRSRLSHALHHTHHYVGGAAGIGGGVIGHAQTLSLSPLPSPATITSLDNDDGDGVIPVVTDSPAVDIKSIDVSIDQTLEIPEEDSVAPARRMSEDEPHILPRDWANPQHRHDRFAPHDEEGPDDDDNEDHDFQLQLDDDQDGDVDGGLVVIDDHGIDDGDDDDGAHEGGEGDHHDHNDVDETEDGTAHTENKAVTQPTTSDTNNDSKRETTSTSTTLPSEPASSSINVTPTSAVVSSTETEAKPKQDWPDDLLLFANRRHLYLLRVDSADPTGTLHSILFFDESTSMLLVR